MKVLVRLPNWLGDLVMSYAFMEQLQRLLPDAQIDVVVKLGRFIGFVSDGSTGL